MKGKKTTQKWYTKKKKMLHAFRNNFKELTNTSYIEGSVRKLIVVFFAPRAYPLHLPVL